MLVRKLPQRLKRRCGDNNLIGMRFDIGKRAVEVKEKCMMFGWHRRYRYLVSHPVLLLSWPAQRWLLTDC
jgi:hypothetical protein